MKSSHLPTAAGNPFHVPYSHENGLLRSVARAGSAAAERLLALPAMNNLYRDIAARPEAHFTDRALAAMGVGIEVSDADLERVPKTGPLIVVANHPFGGVDGLALVAMLRRVRPDVKLLANEMLATVAGLRETLLLVNAFGTHAQRNGKTLREAARWMESGGVLAVFPAGEVSHFDRRSRSVRDGQWSSSAARLATLTGSPVLPVFFEGRNSTLFQVIGLLHPRLRTVLLPRELLKRKGARIAVHIGTPVLPERLQKFGDAREATDYLRLRSYVLGGRTSITKKTRALKRHVQKQEPIAQPGNADALAAEIEGLPEEHQLLSAKDLECFIARGDLIPIALREMGRLREITFRLVGEGTGKPEDLDSYDCYYHHLFVWNRMRREIVGAYRLGLTDEILPALGKEGLYSSTLFRYRGQLLRQLTPGIELGRSFVRVEYQKSYLPLLLLWKGIGQFVANNPRYRMLFGPVSISNDYASLTKQILIAFLKCNANLPSLARLLAPRNAPAFGPPRGSEAALAGTIASSIEDVDELVAEIERDRKRVPVLLRQYLKLGAKLLAFNVDPDFGDVLDGLMLVDLMKVEPTVLGKYMGIGNLQRYRAFHSV